MEGRAGEDMLIARVVRGRWNEMPARGMVCAGFLEGFTSG